MTTTTPTPPDLTFAELRTWLGDRGFVARGSGCVHHHPPTGARVVISKTHPLALTVHAYAGLWHARLTRVPFPVIAATVDAALFVRKDRSR